MNSATTNLMGEFLRLMSPCNQQISYASKARGSEYIEVAKEIFQEMKIIRTMAKASSLK